MWLVFGLIGGLWYAVDGVRHPTERACLRSVVDVPQPYTELRCKHRGR